MPTNMNDLRVIKTLEAIHTSFEELASSKGMGSFTVTELCRQARINKKTFYRYYSGIDDLLAEYQRRLASEYVERTAHLRIPADAAELTRQFILFSCEAGERSPLYERITAGNSLVPLREQMVDQVLESRRISPEGFGNLDADEASIVIAYMQQVGQTVYRQWVADGKRIKPQRLADLAAQLVTRGIEGALY